MMNYVSTFIKYPEMETLKTVKSDSYDSLNHICRHDYTFFETLPPKEFIIEIRVAKTYSYDGSFLADTHLLHNVFNIKTLEEIKKL